MKGFIIGLVVGLSLVAGYASAQDDELDGDLTNLAYVEIGGAAFDLDAQGDSIGCSVELIP